MNGYISRAIYARTLKFHTLYVRILGFKFRTMYKDIRLPPEVRRSCDTQDLVTRQVTKLD
jgi:hypothetical protein